MRIILVEDEVKLARVLSHGLIQKGFAVDVVNDGIKALNRISLNHIDYDLVILDLSLPGMDGASILRSIREQNITTPILILTARDETKSKVDLLLAGADDYLVKPFSFDELLARIQALLRRPTEMIPVVLKVKDIELNAAERKVYKSGTLIPLTLREFNYTSFSNVVDVHIKNLRKKLNRAGEKNMLETVRGAGYRLNG